MSKELDTWSSLEAAEVFFRSAKTSTAATVCYSAGFVFFAKGFDLASTDFCCSVETPGNAWLLPRRPYFSFLNCSLKLIGVACA